MKRIYTLTQVQKRDKLAIENNINLMFKYYSTIDELKNNGVNIEINIIEFYIESSINLISRLITSDELENNNISNIIKSWINTKLSNKKANRPDEIKSDIGKYINTASDFIDYLNNKYGE